ncbi:hypothetical protein CDD83_5031 [Cordyceps sp. RAO-2017]|nr:hypothetical protein CDD83_5031 [Cordyceps sp. RAO-2017]
MEPTAALCYGALAALAIHPDYHLRQEVVALMGEFWFPVHTAAKQNVMIGLLRDGQYELAYARLTEMIEQDDAVDPWVHDIFILVFGRLGFLDEMLLLLLRRRGVEGSDVDETMISLLSFALDVCSQAFHRQGTEFAWTAAVRNSLVQPPDGVVDNVLATAARHGDAVLATEALDMLSKRAWVVVRPFHYEAVAEAFAASGDVAGVLRILCIMQKNGTRLARLHTRAVKAALERSPELIGEAEATLRKLAAEEALPMGLVAVVVEAIAERQGSEAAIDLYRDVTGLCGRPAGAATMQDLMVHSKTGETVRALARDYVSRVSEGGDPPRGPWVYTELIAACANAGELDLAFRFAKQAMGACKTEQQLGWVKPLVEQAAAREDGRIWDVVDEIGGMQDRNIRSMMAQVLRRTTLARKASAMASATAKATATASPDHDA